MLLIFFLKFSVSEIFWASYNTRYDWRYRTSSDFIIAGYNVKKNGNFKTYRICYLHVGENNISAFRVMTPC
jgi:hypothetical protein